MTSLTSATSIVFRTIRIVIHFLLRWLWNHHVASTVRHSMWMFMSILMLKCPDPGSCGDWIGCCIFRFDFIFMILLMTLIRWLMMTIARLVIQTILFRWLQALRILHPLLILAVIFFWVRSSRRDHASYCTFCLSNRPVITYPLHLIAWIDWSRLTLSLLIEYASSLACPTCHVRTSIFLTLMLMVLINWECALFTIALWARSIVRFLIRGWRWFARLHPKPLRRRSTSPYA